ncbi:MAG: TonB-dependent receptor [Verrucomicrobia bacterium]|nr:TonB-dependent receptor [Verrucomicrobiota bacterium]
MPSPKTRSRLPRQAALLLILTSGSFAFAQSAAAPAASTAAPGDTVVLSPFTVSTSKDWGYGATNSMTASRAAIPISDISSSIVVLNEQFFRDRSAIDATDVLNYISGIQKTSDNNPGQAQFSLRGFSVGSISLRDGLPGPVATQDYPLDENTAYERTEVLKGPAGTLYGSHSMGGVVNSVSKWPKFKAETKTEFTAQSYEQFFRALVDTTGPLTKQLAYRLALSVRNGDRFFDEGDAPSDLYSVVGGATWLLGANGSLGKVWGRAEYLDASIDREQGNQFLTGFFDPARPVPTVPSAAPTISNPRMPLSIRANTVPDDDISNMKRHFFEGGYERTFPSLLGGTWSVRLVARASGTEGDKSPSYAQSRPVPVTATGAIVRFTNAAGVLTNGDSRFIAAGDPMVADWRSTLVLRDFRAFAKNRGAYLDLVGDFSTAFLRHKLVVSSGVSGSEAQRAFFFWNALNPANTTAVANSFSAINPVPAGVTARSIKNSAAVKQFNAFLGHTLGQGYSYAFQDNISFLEGRVIYVVGARHDEVRATTDRFDTPQSLAQDRFVINPALRSWSSTDANTVKNGLIVKPFKGAFDGVSLFGTANQTFNPVSSVSSVTGQKFPDQRGKSKEVGIKADLLGGKLTGTFSYFRNELTNVLVGVVNPIELGGGIVQAPIGVQKTSGWEFDLAATPVPSVNLLASASKLTSKDELGRFFRGVPTELNYSVMARYSFLRGSLKGAYTGLSFKRVARFAGDTPNSFFVSGSETCDAFFGYDRAKWGVQVNVSNLANDDSVYSTVSDSIVSRYLPRTYRLTLRYKF